MACAQIICVILDNHLNNCLLIQSFIIYGETDVSTKECEMFVISNGPSNILIEVEHVHIEGKGFPYNDNDDVRF